MEQGDYEGNYTGGRDEVQASAAIPEGEHHGRATITTCIIQPNLEVLIFVQV